MSDEIATLYCANHPKVPTGLRCISCEKPICPKCAVLTPTGYRCKECVRGHQKVFETAQWFDYPLAIAPAFILGLLGNLISAQIGFLTLFIAPIAGVIIAEVVRFLTRRRRARRLTLMATIGAIAGGVMPLLFSLGAALLLGGLFNSLWPMIWQVVYVATIAPTIYYRLGGIRIQ
ncbi:MAG: B-box zinc finger protein [Chloroflexota bacterium]